MTRFARVQAIVEAIGRLGKHAWMLSDKARRQIAEVALDAADKTREAVPSPCPWCEHKRHYSTCTVTDCSCPTTLWHPKRARFVMPAG